MSSPVGQHVWEYETRHSDKCSICKLVRERQFPVRYGWVVYWRDVTDIPVESEPACR